MDVISSASDVLSGLADRLRHAISFDMSQNQLIRMLIVLIMYISVIRPWMLKLAEKEGMKQLGAMEERDRNKREKEQKTQAVHNLRGNKKSADSAQDDKDITATGSQLVDESNGSKSRQRATQEAEDALMNAEETRAQNLENWDEDQEFLKMFSKTSDRSYA